MNLRDSRQVMMVLCRYPAAAAAPSPQLLITNANHTFTIPLLLRIPWHADHIRDRNCNP